ncbi:MAG: hypothetical protein ACI8UO_001496 [Verrucomicrobiales bacterium]|jgi:hypothetical protein
MTNRVLVEEILDHLPADDPDAIASRRDLLRLNRIFGNFRWIKRALSGATEVVELGAGDAHLARQAVELRSDLKWTAIDLAPRPLDLPDSIDWCQGDLFEQLPKISGDALVANLFLHHLDDAQLRELGQQLLRFRLVVCSEPARFRIFHAGGYALRIFGLNRVTKHDLHVSIDAGFRGRELPEMLGLDPKIWKIGIRHTMLGMYRMVAEKVEP